MSKKNDLRVWDRPVRLLHWSLVATVVAAWVTRHRIGELHVWFGYATALIVAVRILWGFVGSPYARFGQFLHAPGVTWRYANELLANRAPRYLGHNPLGGWMIVTLLAVLALLDFTGWLFTTDTFWGYEWLSSLHQRIAWTLVACISLHVSAVTFMSWRKRENLIAAMLSGNKPERQTHGDPRGSR